jgi:hypothetical protein
MSAQLGWHLYCSQMQQESMLVYPCCRLCAAVAIRFLEIKGGDAMLAEGACEGGAAIHRFGCVISHIFMVVLLPVRAWGQ